MNRCAICDVTDEDNPQAKIQWICTDPEAITGEYRCLECHANICENVEDLSLSDEEFEFSI